MHISRERIEWFMIHERSALRRLTREDERCISPFRARRAVYSNDTCHYTVFVPGRRDYAYDESALLGEQRNTIHRLIAPERWDATIWQQLIVRSCDLSFSQFIRTKLRMKKSVLSSVMRALDELKTPTVRVLGKHLYRAGWGSLKAPC